MEVVSENSIGDLKLKAHSGTDDSSNDNVKVNGEVNGDEEMDVGSPCNGAERIQAPPSENGVEPMNTDDSYINNSDNYEDIAESRDGRGGGPPASSQGDGNSIDNFSEDSTQATSTYSRSREEGVGEEEEDEVPHDDGEHVSSDGGVEGVNSEGEDLSVERSTVMREGDSRRGVEDDMEREDEGAEEDMDGEDEGLEEPVGAHVPVSVERVAQDPEENNGESTDSAPPESETEVEKPSVEPKEDGLEEEEEEEEDDEDGAIINLVTPVKSLDGKDRGGDVTPEKSNSNKKKKTQQITNVTPRRSSRNLNKTKSYVDDTGVKSEEDDVQEVPENVPPPHPPPPALTILPQKKHTIVVNDTKRLAEIAAGSKAAAAKGGKKEPTLVIIDTNSLLANKVQGQVSLSPATSRVSVMPVSQNVYSPKPIKIPSVTSSPVTITPPPPKAQNILPSLTDDMYVVEAPSFIVPYVYEKPPINALKEYLKDLEKKVKEEDQVRRKKEEVEDAKKELVRKEEERKRQELSEKPTRRLEQDQEDEDEEAGTKDEKPQCANKEADKPVDKEEDKMEVDKEAEEDNDKEEVKDIDSKTPIGVSMEVDTPLSASNENEEIDAKEDKDKETKKDESEVETEEEKSTDVVEKKSTDSEEKKITVVEEKKSVVEEEKKSTVVEVKKSTVVEEKKATTVEEKKVSNVEEKKSTDVEVLEDKTNKKSDSYFDNPLGKFFMQIGINLVQEHVQADLLRNQLRKREKEGNKCSADVHMAISTLTKTLEISKENNRPFRFEMKKCQLCNFRTESQLVMAHHLETPHMKNFVYRCNFCELEVRSPHDILFHMEAEHNVRGRLDRSPAFHQCPNCPFEDNQKGKLSRHLLSCAKKYKPERNQEPPLEWEPPAKIPRVRGARGLPLYPGGAPAGGLSRVVPGATPLGRLAASQAALAAQRGRGRPPIYVQRYPTSPSAQKLAAHIRQGGVVFRPSNQPPVLLPTAPYSLAPSLLQAKGVSNGATAKLLQQPSISITPLPRGGGVSALPQGSSVSATLTSASSQPKPGRPPTSTPAKNSFVICEICDGYIKDLEQLRNHMQWIHKVKIHPKMIYNRPPLNCQKCQFRFFTDQGLERHLLGSHGLVTSSMQEAANKGKDGGRCPVCGRVYQWKLLNHVARDHSMSLKPAHLSYKCTVCTATFGMYKQFENHVYSAHSVVAKRVIDKSKPSSATSSATSSTSSSQQPSTSSNSNQASSESLLKPLKINDEITIIPQPARAKGAKGPVTTSASSAKPLPNK